MPSVSHSEVESYLTCRRKHWYGYGLSLQKVDDGAGLAMGSAGHEVLAAYYRTLLEAGDTNRKQRAAHGAGIVVARAKFRELVEAGYKDIDEKRMPLEKLLFEIYFENEPLVQDGYTVLAVEKEYNLEYDTENELRLPFVIDLIVRTPDKRVSIVDHKFVGQFYSDRDVLLMPQIPKYIAGLRALGHTVHEGVYNLIKTTNIKGDKMTKAQLVEALGGPKLDVGPGDVIDLNKMTMAVLEPMAQQAGISVYAGPKIEQMLAFIPVKPTNMRVQQTFVEQIDTAAEIQRRKEMEPDELDRVSFRVADKRICTGCSFFDLCETELSGGNVKLLMQSEYKVRERKVFVEIDEAPED